MHYYFEKPFSVAIAAMLLCPLAANAQVLDQADADIVVVTATRRAQNIHDVPISITAFSKAQLESLRPTGLEELGRNVPNMWMPPSTEAGQSFITMRGINGGIARSSGRSVGVYIDGVYVNADTAMNLAVNNVASVEVLKGPQGSLFGRDTIGGAINITTQKPGHTNAGEIEMDIGNFGYRQFKGFVDIPLEEDILALRLSGLKRDTDGYIKNAFTGRNAGAEDRAAFGAQLYYTPNARFNAHLNFNAHTIDDRPNTQGEAVTNIGADTIPYTINLGSDEVQEQDAQRASLNANWQLGGGHTISSVTGWSHVSDFYLQDGDRLPQEITLAQFDGKADEFSQELRLTSPTGKTVDYLVGLYYLSSNTLFSPTFPLMSTAFLNQVLFLPQALHPEDSLDGQRIEGHANSYAGFAHANFHLTDRLTIFGGARLTHDKKTVDYASFGEVFTVFGLPPLSARTTAKDTPFSWMVGGRYKVSNAIMAYASISRGYRSASIKDDFVSAADIAAGAGFFTAPEFLTNYEVGMKAQMWDGKVRANLSAFYMDYQDIQVSVSRPPFLFLQSLVNAAKAHIVGFEADVTASVSPNLKLSASAGYIRSRFDRFSPRPGLDLAGTSFGTAPVWTLSAIADYRQPLANGGMFLAHADYTNRTAPSTVPPGALGFVGDYAIVNGWIGYEPQQQNWRVSLWAKNLFDINRPAANKLWGAGLGPLIENETVRYEPPRMVGVSLKYKWGG